MSLKIDTALSEWCVEKKVFSKKTNGGYYLPNGKFMQVPSGISRGVCGVAVKDEMGLRRTSAWRIGVTGLDGEKKKFYITDKSFDGDWMKSYEHALQLIKEIRGDKLNKSGTRANNRERKTKKYKLGTPGISISKHTDQRNGRQTYRFIISVGTKKKSLTIGTTLDFNSEDFKNALDVAKRRHAELNKDRASVNSFKNIEPKKMKCF